MQEYIESILHQKIKLELFEGVQELPLYLIASYTLFQMTIIGQHCILAVPKEQIRLSDLRKHQKRIQKLTGQYCVLYFKDMNYYSKDKMLKEGIPFIWEEKQIYMPFLGLFLQENTPKKLMEFSEISFLTQKFLLRALYEEWNDLNATMAAEKMSVSKMSITRIYNEIESMNIPVLKIQDRKRRFIQCGTKREMWKIIEPFMRNPLLKEYYIEEDINEDYLKSGISGLAEMSMLNDNEYMTYAFSKNKIKKEQITKLKQIPKDEKPGCIIQELGYSIPFKNNTVIDPLSIYLLLKDDMQDPRTEMAIEEMLEDYVW